MKSDDELHNRIEQILCAIVWGAIAVILVLHLSGCTIAPKPVHSQTVSFSGNLPNAGILGFAVDDSFRLRFLALYTRFQASLSTNLPPDMGLTKSGSIWIADDQAMELYLRLNRSNKSGKLQ